jgi:hypothetical protein
MRALALLALAAFSSGCATIQDHPYATSFAVAFVAGSIVASQQHDNRMSSHAPGTASIQTPSCVGGSCQ